MLIPALLLSAQANAQPVVQAAHAQLQPQIGRDAKGYSLCGMRAVVLDVMPSSVEAYDFSINLRAGMFDGLLKAGKSTISKPDFLKGKQSQKTVVPGPVNFWIAKETEGKALTPTKIIPADTAGFVLGAGDFVQSWETVLAMLQGDRMQFAVRYKDQGYDTVISFSGALKEEESKPLLACLDGMAERLQRELPAKSKE